MNSLTDARFSEVYYLDPFYFLESTKYRITDTDTEMAYLVQAAFQISLTDMKLEYLLCCIPDIVCANSFTVSSRFASICKKRRFKRYIGM